MRSWKSAARKRKAVFILHRPLPRGCNTLQHTTTHCNTLPNATHYITLHTAILQQTCSFSMAAPEHRQRHVFEILKSIFSRKYLDAMRLVLGIPDFLKLKIHRIVMGSRVRIQNLGRQVAYNEQVCRFFVYVSLAEI